MSEATAANVITLPAPIMSSDVYSSPAAFEFGQRVAKSLAASTLVPEHLRKNDADALAALAIARAMGEQPIVVMQAIYFVSGRAGWKTDYMIARANRAGVFRGRITWATSGGDHVENLAVTAKAVLADTGEVVTATATMQMAMAEGWVKNPKYRTMPEHMLRWRSATMLIRLYCPEVMLGLPAADEIEDAATVIEARDVTPPATAKLNAFAAAVPVPTFEPAAAAVQAPAPAPAPAEPAEPFDMPGYIDHCRTIFADERTAEGVDETLRDMRTYATARGATPADLGEINAAAHARKQQIGKATA